MTSSLATTLGYGGEHHHHHDGEDIFKYEHTHDQRGKLLLLESEVVERLIDNSGGRHGKHTCQEEGIHL